MVYNAIVDYHNNLAQIRFTVAGIFLATNGFLASVAIQGQESLIWFVLSFLGVLIAVICWLLDTRNYQLLENLGTRGNEIEKSLGIKDNQSFFYLMAVQPIEPRVMPTFKEMKKNNLLRYMVSHTVLFNLIYTIFGAGWFIAFLSSLTYIIIGWLK
jgi:hypothetical protein